VSNVLALVGGVVGLFWAGHRFGPKPVQTVIVDYEDGGYEAVIVPKIPGTPDELLEAIDR
jgi:hypothetical protein